MIWGAATKVMSKIVDTESKDDKLDRDNIIKRTLGLADTGIPIGREGEPAGYVRWDAKDNDTFNAGASGTDAEGVKWREFLWTGPAHIDECEWGTVRWRFYENGLICLTPKWPTRVANWITVMCRGTGSSCGKRMDCFLGSGSPDFLCAASCL